ncbi:MAG TPA: ABC transporter permease, partial [Acidimicrobiia bacterium]|nr:ABC transporter permease [Acidimicrobiia bacterium]
MLSLTLKNLWARKLRLVTTGVAVLIGVAFMAGTLVLTDTVQATFDDLFADVNAGMDVQVRRASTVESDGFEVRGRVDASALPIVESVDGVELAAGAIQGFTQITGTDGKPIGNPGQGAPTFGMSWLDDDDLNPFDVVEGRAPEADNEIVIDRGSAKDGKISVGDVIELDAARPVPPMTVVGIVMFGNADSPGGASFVGYTLEAAQAYVGEPGQYDAIVVRAADGVTQDELRSRIEAALPDGLEARTGAEITAENQSDIREGLSFFSTFMLTFALIALFVGSFIIYNTFSILVAQRTREVALLRAVGASRRQVLQSIVVESLAVGVIASVLGLVAGIGVAGALKALLTAVGIDIPAGGTVLTTGTIVTSLVTGVVVTMVAALMPARRAAKVAPVAALSEAAAETDDHLGKRIALGGVVTAVGSAAGFYGLFLAGSKPQVFVGLGGVVMFIGLAILGPVIARPVASAIGRPLPAFRGMAGTLARENAIRNPRRTSATAAALMIGVALVGFITIFAS